MTLFPAYLSMLFAFFCAAGGLAYGAALQRQGVSLRERLRLRDVPLLAAAFLPLLLVVLPLLLARNFHLLYWHLPLELQYYAGPAAWTYTLGLLAFAACIVGMLGYAGRSARLIALLTAAAIAAVAEWGIRQSPFLRPPALEQARVVDGVVLQTSDATCASAATANILRYFGKPASEAEMAVALGNTAFGTSVAQVAHGLKSLGYTCIKRHIASRDYTELNPPALLFVDFGTEPLGHVVSFMGSVDGKAEILNPQGGRSFQSPEQLASWWRGHALVVRRSKR